MKNVRNISIKNPCSENFNTFNTTKLGGFCNTCNKEVIDFTKMTDTEIRNYFLATKTNTCGRFKVVQLESNKQPIMPNYIFKGIATMSFSLLTLCAISNVKAQETQNQNINTSTEIVNIQEQNQGIIKGSVLDEENMPLPGVNVILKGSTEGTVTDLDGNFEFPKELKTNDVLIFSYIGYETKKHKINESTIKTGNIVINFTNIDMELMGEIVVGQVYQSKRNIFQKFIGIFK